jgi:hypothetical protein
LEKKGKEELHSLYQSTKWDRGESYFERYYKNGWSPWFREIKMNGRAFVSINRMGAGHTGLEPSLNRFNLCPRPNANVMMGCKWRNISSGIVNCTRTNRQQ